jgi:anti-sigma B factor antagonist
MQSRLMNSETPVTDTQPAKITVNTDGGSITLHLPGVIDLSIADDLRAIGEAAAHATNTEHVYLDCGEVTFIDSTGLGAMVRINNTAGSLGRRLALTRVPPKVIALLTRGGLIDAFVVSERTS